MPVWPSGNVALRMRRSAMYWRQQQVPRFTRDDICGNLSSRASARDLLFSLRPEYPVACIAQTRHDVAVLVQLPIDRAGVERHIGMRVSERANAFRTRNQ